MGQPEVGRVLLVVAEFERGGFVGVSRVGDLEGVFPSFFEFGAHVGAVCVHTHIEVSSVYVGEYETWRAFVLGDAFVFVSSPVVCVGTAPKGNEMERCIGADE